MFHGIVRGLQDGCDPFTWRRLTVDCVCCWNKHQQLRQSYILKLQWWCLSVTGLSVLHNPVTVSMAELCGLAGGGERGEQGCVRLSVHSTTVPRFN